MIRQLKFIAAIPVKVLVGILALTGLIILSVLLFLPVVLFRRFLFHSSKFFRPDLDKMVNSAGTGFAFQDVYESTIAKIVVGVTLEGSPTKTEILRRLEKTLKIMDKSSAEPLYTEMTQEMVPWCGYRFWKDIPNFKLVDYLTVIKHRVYTFDEAIEEMRNQTVIPFERGKALWNITIISKCQLNEKTPYYNPTKTYSFLIFGCHHSLFDGVSAMNFLKSVSHIDAQERANQNYVRSKTTYKIIKEFIKIIPRVPYDIGHSVLTTSKTQGIWEKANRSEKNSEEKSTKKQSKFAYAYGLSDLLDFSKVKQASRLHKVSSIAVISACICGSVRSTMFSSKKKIPSKVNFGFPVPIFQHPSKLRNHVSAVTIPVSLREPDPLKRLAKIDRNIRRGKSSTSTVFGFFMNILMMSFPPAFINSVLYKFGHKQQIIGLSSFAGPSDELVQLFTDCYVKDITWITSATAKTQCLLVQFTTYCGYARLSVEGDYSVLTSDTAALNLTSTFSSELNYLLQNAPVQQQHEQIV